MGPAKLVWILCALSVFAQERHGESQGDPAFPWGQTYGEWRVQRSAMIVRAVPGESVLVKKGEILFLFSFHRPQKIKQVRTALRDENGRTDAVFDGLDLEPAVGPEQAALYSVTVYYPALPLNDELKASLAKIGAASVPDADQFTIDLPSTLVQVVFNRYREKRYLDRIVFTSRKESERRSADLDLLKKQADQDIKRAVEERRKEIPAQNPWMRSEAERK